MYRVVGFLVLFALSGCAQAQLEHQTASFNRATASAISEQTLLNAVRSSLDMPMSFTKLQQFTAFNMASGSLAPKFPFGADALRLFDFGPNLTLHPGVGEIVYADANNSGALAKLNQSLRYDTVDRYINEGMSLPLLGTVLVRYVEVHKSLMAALKDQLNKQCHADAQNKISTCGEIKRIGTRCGDTLKKIQPVRLEGGHEFYTIANNARSECEFLAYQAFLYLLRIGKMGSDLIPDRTYERLKTVEGRLFAVPKAAPRQGINFQIPEMQATFVRLQDSLKKHKHRAPIKFALRSPRSLLTYLGGLIALQNASKDRFVPRIMLAGGERITVFRVLRGSIPAMPSALTLRGPDGEIYSVPRPEYGSKDDQTLRVLTMAGELVNGAISEKDFPAPASIVVRAIQ